MDEYIRKLTAFLSVPVFCRTDEKHVAYTCAEFQGIWLCDPKEQLHFLFVHPLASWTVTVVFGAIIQSISGWFSFYYSVFNTKQDWPYSACIVEAHRQKTGVLFLLFDSQASHREAFKIIACWWCAFNDSWKCQTDSWIFLSFLSTWFDNISKCFRVCFLIYEKIVV